MGAFVKNNLFSAFSCFPNATSTQKVLEALSEVVVTSDNLTKKGETFKGEAFQRSKESEYSLCETREEVH